MILSRPSSPPYSPTFTQWTHIRVYLRPLPETLLCQFTNPTNGHHSFTFHANVHDLRYLDIVIPRSAIVPPHDGYLYYCLSFFYFPTRASLIATISLILPLSNILRLSTFGFFLLISFAFAFVFLTFKLFVSVYYFLL